MAFLLFILSVIVAIAFLSLPFINLSINYYEARKIGLPIIISPVSNRLTPLLNRLPFRLGRFVNYNGFECFFKDRYRLHARFGPAFCIVTAGDILLVVADAEATSDILARWKYFVKPQALFKNLELFGPNVDTVNGESWQRHRRLTAPPFNERNSSLVWRESLVQAGAMLQSWISAGRQGVTKTTNDTMTLALHVLIGAGFGKSYNFDSGLTTQGDGHNLSYRDALRTVLNNIYTSVAITSNALPPGLVTRKIGEVENAIAEFKQYMVEMVEEEKSSAHHTNMGKENLMSVLVRASEAEANGKGRNSMTDEEIFGNLFIYNFAGHDTTANTLGYAITLMASDPHWQAWIREELASIFGERVSAGEDDYETAFPQLKRCLALLFETLRLYGPVVAIPKCTGDASTTVAIQGKEHLLPPKTNVIVNFAAPHTLPQHWGSDSLIWRPDRWITNSKDTTGVEREELIQVPPGVFVPWASGPRVCPGKKFAEVEFVAVIAHLFRKHRVVPGLVEDETVDDAEKRILDAVEDSKFVMTLQMKESEKIKLVWEEG